MRKFIFAWTLVIAVMFSFAVSFEANSADTSEEEVKKEIKKSPSVVSYLKEGNRSLSQKNHDRAIDEYKKAIELKPDDEEAYHN